MIQRYLLVWLCLLSLAAYYWPLRFDPFVYTAPALQCVFAVSATNDNLSHLAEPTFLEG